MCQSVFTLTLGMCECFSCSCRRLHVAECGSSCQAAVSPDGPSFSLLCIAIMSIFKCVCKSTNFTLTELLGEEPELAN